MICLRCQSDSFKTIKVLRAKRFSIDKKTWLHDDKTDTRRIICEECNAVFMTETKLVSAEIYNSELLKKIIKPAQESLFHNLS